MKTILSKAARQIRGATLVEYVLLISLIAVLAIGALQFLGQSAAGALWNVGNQISHAGHGHH